MLLETTRALEVDSSADPKGTQSRGARNPKIPAFGRWLDFLGEPRIRGPHARKIPRIQDKNSCDYFGG